MHLRTQKRKQKKPSLSTLFRLKRSSHAFSASTAFSLFVLSFFSCFLSPVSVNLNRRRPSFQTGHNVSEKPSAEREREREFLVFLLSLYLTFSL